MQLREIQYNKLSGSYILISKNRSAIFEYFESMRQKLLINHIDTHIINNEKQIKMFYSDLNYKTDLNEIELAAFTHAEFVKTHPFVDGNGRISRLIMNYQLMKSGFLPISIDKKDRLKYYNALEEYAVNDNLLEFVDMIANLQEEQLMNYIKMV